MVVTLENKFSYNAPLSSIIMTSFRRNAAMLVADSGSGDVMDSKITETRHRACGRIPPISYQAPLSVILQISIQLMLKYTQILLLQAGMINMKYT
ncbi:hypothetical protein CEXT_125051 [Caerostris extrusa]|uniref:Uncharacterized protein n=1 Tax=Caerostris extrusa TaxID=172846 RepID=A0AAV4TKN1_CAEEX|nr:hypothetical protein CEXT_125051 [Caerostris extrusa]